MLHERPLQQPPYQKLARGNNLCSVFFKMCVLFFHDSLRSVLLGLFRKTEELVCKQLSEHRCRCCHHVYHTGIVHLEVNYVCSRVDWTLPILSDVELFCNGDQHGNQTSR